MMMMMMITDLAGEISDSVRDVRLVSRVQQGFDRLLAVSFCHLFFSEYSFD